MLPQILELSDYIRTTGREAVNAAGGSFKNYKHIDKTKDGKPSFVMPFTGQPTDWRVNMAAAMPILAAFRRFLEVDPKSPQGAYRWINDDFNRVKSIWDSIAVDAHRATNSSLASLGRSLTNLGKSRAHWDSIDRIVEVAELRQKVAAATS